MKRILLFFLQMPVILSAQYHFDFENDTTGGWVECTGGWWKQVPGGRWECDTYGAISGDYSLHHSHDNHESGCDYLLISHDPLYDPDSLALSFRVKHAYPSSSANNWQVALLADFSNEGAFPGQITGGVILGVNFTGSDDQVKLWSCIEGNCDQICSTSINYQEHVGTEAAPLFRLVWYRGGKLDLYYTRDPPEGSTELVGSCQLDSLPTGRQLVVRYEYSASQDRKLWLDDITLDGNFVPDTIAPALLRVEVMDGTHLQLLFSEVVPAPECSSFLLSVADQSDEQDPGWNLNPDTISVLDSSLVLRFPGSIPNRKELNLLVTGICDADGNCMPDTLVRCMRNEAEWGDVVFNEIMYDPDPAVRLSGDEYLEIYNRSSYDLDLEGWRVDVNDRAHMITGLTVDPGQYGLLYDFTLPNDGATLALYSRDGTLVHAARYGIPWKGPDWKKEGGWSLESPDPDLVCNTTGLWEFSTDRMGGTPGRLNSNDSDLEDREPPVFLYFGYGEPGTVHIYYSEPVRLSPMEIDRVSVVPGEVHPDSVVPGFPLSDQMALYFSEDLQDRSGSELRLPSVADCSGNLSRELTIRIGEASVPRFGSLLINEIMYDPVDWAPEYIELYNPGNRLFDLQDLSVDVVKKGASPANPLPLSGLSRIFPPGEYLVITRSVPHLMDAYYLELSGRWLERGGVAELINSGGTIYLTNRSGEIMDMANYGDHLHMDLLDDMKGISLERISPDRPGTDPGNWHSAASIEGYATPGRKNSQSVNGPGSAELLKVDPAVFSPDNDGYQDLLVISVSSKVQGCVMRMWITDLAGNRVRSLANNHLTGPSVRYVWDGERDDGQMASEGIYVVLVWMYNPVSGERWSRKAAAGIIYR
ncbi:MAG: lamin tail domain-containing protein [Bacteroidales bacterium]|nr:lamin tail domain-containing protein [Bacteroidales bacterium]